MASERLPELRCVLSLPGAIPVRYREEEEAREITNQPVVRRRFRPDQLLDVVLSVAGEGAKRIRLSRRSLPAGVHTESHARFIAATSITAREMARSFPIAFATGSPAWADSRCSEASRLASVSDMSEGSQGVGIVADTWFE